MEETYTIKEVANIAKMDMSSLRYRMKVLGIKSDIERKSGKVVFLNKEEVDALLNFEKSNASKINYNSDFYSKKKILVIECFLKFRDNSSREISEYLDLKESYVSNAINEYLENNSTILVRSNEI